MIVDDPPELTVRYVGDVLEASQVDGKIRFAVDGQAVLTRRQHLHREVPPQFKPVRYVLGDVTASLHVVPDASSPGDRGDPPSKAGQSPAAPPTEASGLLFRTAQASPAFAAVTALSPGAHILCYLPPSEAADRLTWQESCSYLLQEAAGSPGFRATLPRALSFAERLQTPLQGWALVSCESSDNLICALARGSWKGDGGRVAWFHSTDTGELAVADDLLLTSIGRQEPAYASVSARGSGNLGVEVVAEAHRVLAGGVLSGYDASLGEPGEKNGAVFVDDSTEPAHVGQGWRGTVSAEEMPGGGLHRHVRVKIDASCAGKACDSSSWSDSDAQARTDHEWCEVTIAQHVPQGIYIDVDEVKARHNFDVLSPLPTDRRVGVETFEGQSIDVELPSSVSGQHLVNFSLRVNMSKRHREREKPSIRAEMTLPVHLRYPDPGCERRGEVCEEYAWVEVPPPLASVRCGSATDAGPFYPVLPSSPPVGVGLRVPRGIAWHRGVVMWGTVVAAALGCAYTVYTLVSVMSVGAARESSKKRR
eukprot:g2908.t1